MAGQICEKCGGKDIYEDKCVSCGPFVRVLIDECECCGSEMMPLKGPDSPEGVVCKNGCIISCRIYQYSSLH